VIGFLLAVVVSVALAEHAVVDLGLVVALFLAVVLVAVAWTFPGWALLLVVGYAVVLWLGDK